MAEADLFFAGVFVVVIAFGLVIAGVIWNGFSAKMTNSVLNESSGAIFQKIDRTFGFFDGAIVFVQVVLILSLIFSVFLINSHPAFFVVSLFLLVISIFLGGIYQDLWESLSSNSAVNETINNQFNLTNKLFSNYPIILTVVGFLFLIALYAKLQSGDGGFR